MPEPLATIDIILRAAAAAISLFAAVQFARLRPPRFLSISGILFVISAAAYALVSTPTLAGLFGPMREVPVVLAVLLPAFFWWFVLGLFHDDFHMRWVHWIPPTLFLVFYGLRQKWGAGIQEFAMLAHEALLLLLLVHVVMLALVEFRNDLVDARRRFRIALALLIPLAGVVIAAAETWEVFSGPVPAWLVPLHALMLLALSSLFVLWLTGPKPELLGPPTEAPKPRAEFLSPADLIELDQLKAAIADGICLQPGLSLTALAATVGVPEHRLRRLIGKGLGYRNFAAFVNDHRVEEAMRRLADPKRAREQVATIAFDLGYASLAPFNRAFRQIVGATPTEFRAQALSKSVET